MLLVSSTTEAKTGALMNAKTCDRAWEEIRAASYEPSVSINDLISRWEARQSDCGGTGAYEDRLATLYIYAHKFDQAETLISAALKLDTSDKRNLKLLLITIDSLQLNHDVATSRARELIEEYPDWAGGYQALGAEQLAQKHYSDAIDSLEKALRRNPGKAVTAGIYSELTLAWYYLKNYRNAIIASQHAGKMNNALFAREPLWVMATAYSLVNLGYLKAAEDLLEKSAKLNPAIQKRNDFRRAKKYLDKKLHDHSGSAESTGDGPK